MKILKVQSGKKYKKKNQIIKMGLFWINQTVSNPKLKNSNLFDTLFIYLLQLKRPILTILNNNLYCGVFYNIINFQNLLNTFF